MRYRTLSPTGDYTFGSSLLNFLSNSPQTVAQAVQTRLLLMEGEWFMDKTEGTPYRTQILGKNKQSTYDPAIRERILNTQGVLSIESFQSYLSPQRQLSVQARISTIYGEAQLAASINISKAF